MLENLFVCRWCRNTGCTHCEAERDRHIAHQQHIAAQQCAARLMVISPGYTQLRLDVAKLRLDHASAERFYDDNYDPDSPTMRISRQL